MYAEKFLLLLKVWSGGEEEVYITYSFIPFYLKKKNTFITRALFGV